MIASEIIMTVLQAGAALAVGVFACIILYHIFRQDTS